MAEKDMFLQGWEREFQITMKVLKAFPPDKLEFKPHERSRTARDLAWVFVGDEAVVDMVAKGKIDFSGDMPKPPATWSEILVAYEKTHKGMVPKIKNMPEADYNSIIQFPIGPNQMSEFRKADVLWLLMMDAVHHRGQFSIYLRMAGGKVPSIYGPSADEPWM
ncbi:MAG: DinB family protein [bacterium]